MGENSAIEWCDHTFNPWTGCTKISPACDHCYAERLSHRNPAALGSWEPGAPRRRTSAQNWLQPRRWNAKAEKQGRRYRVFCASLADVFDNQAPEAWRTDLWRLIRETPHLDWLLLTKRPQNIDLMLPDDWGMGWPNVWLGTTVENQREADRRLIELLEAPAVMHFVSCEPLLEAVDLRHWLWRVEGERRDRLGWVIAGGESGAGARPMHPDWLRALRAQCAAADVPFLFKQWGEWAPYGHDAPDWFFAPLEVPRRPPLHDWPPAPHPTLGHHGFRYSQRVGKVAAGRELDGRTHDDFPLARAA